MKQLLIIASLLTILASPTRAQDDNDQKGGRIEALKIAYITKKLNLSPTEAQKFWPIYNNYASEIKGARMEQRKNKGSELEAEDKILNIRKKYSTEFSHAISNEKINTFFRSEKEFGNYVQKELQQRRELRQQRTP
ncbi:MAG: hypothetical protein H0X41_14215 [Chitinophagaceae bacterium]|nr:hypothetical protein [Chitinophagaceae bacterium]